MTNTSPKTFTKGPKAHEEMVHVFGRGENTNRNHHEVPRGPSRMCAEANRKGVGEDVENWEP